MSVRAATIRVIPEALAAASVHARQAATDLEHAHGQAGRVLEQVGAALDATGRAALADLVQAWALLGAQIAATTSGLSSSLATSATHYERADQALALDLQRALP